MISSPGPGKRIDHNKLEARRARRALLGIDVSAEGRQRARSKAESKKILAQGNRAKLADDYLCSPAGKAGIELAKVSDVISQGLKQPKTWDEVNSSGAGGSVLT